MHKLEVADHMTSRVLDVEAKTVGLATAFVAARFSGEERYHRGLTKLTETKWLASLPLPLWPPPTEKGSRR
jgi:hypothetical protein